MFLVILNFTFREKNKRWDSIFVIPKGKMEDEEKAKETAREISEETWLPIDKLEVIKFITKINFTFNKL